MAKTHTSFVTVKTQEYMLMPTSSTLLPPKPQPPQDFCVVILIAHLSASPEIVMVKTSSKGRSQKKMSATRHALSLCELVAEILSYFPLKVARRGHYSSLPSLHKPQAALAQYGLVNRIWFRQAMFHLWKHIGGDEKQLRFIFRGIDLHCRQLYANFVETCWVRLVCTSREAQEVFEDLTFHNLHTLIIPLTSFGMQPARRFLPKMNAPRLDTVELYIPYGVEVIFDTQKTKPCFPTDLQVRAAP
ncbi:uncharacterized protein N7477_010168 [Penicillium maclennaniae]|uniref:uncharacterized protein n=1 Tax=Penicillium maclennaniae TaxID=1343394 RepID=UPI0025405566|nr:uncharacterized protein N7477_010168 [Penicillium maclennaniae]KAJ5662552.1 hypothetical protein N7477_010168 [Penicillium maclennaniae]